MRKILLLGAGKSSIYLIDYLLEHAQEQKWQLTVADLSAHLAIQKTKGRVNSTAIAIDIHDMEQRQSLIKDHDIIISMLPASLHTLIANDCLNLNKNLVTPSYISAAMKGLESEVKSKGLIFMNEMGLDPGIDHASAMEIFHRLEEHGSRIISFKSHCGGLVAPESDTNDWHYKFSWNPRNVILAGQGDGGIKWRENGETQEITYQQLFHTTTAIDLGAEGIYTSYPNRDSLKYIEAYQLEGIDTIYRGTLRVPPFCEGWAALVSLGLTDASKPYNFVPKETIIERLGLDTNSQILSMLEGIGIFDARNFKLNVSAADSLQALLDTQWAMQPADRDLVVMVHEIEYMERSGVQRKLTSSLFLKGTDSEHTAMAMTVGLPLAIVTKMIMNGEISTTGVLMPTLPEIYVPLLRELKHLGIAFKEVVE